MKLKLQWIIITLSILLCVCQCQNRTLKFVFELNRHGARAPINKNLDADEWDVKLGYITDIGLRQHYLIGTEIRKRYIHLTKLLNDSLILEEISVSSTNSERTIQSAQAQLVGIYPKYKTTTARENLDNFGIPPLNINDIEELHQILDGRTILNDYQPIPIFTKNTIRPSDGGYCPNANIIRNYNSNQQIQIRFNYYLSEIGFLQKFSEQFGIPIQEIQLYKINQYYDTIYCDIKHGRGLPNNITHEFYDWIRFVNDFGAIMINVGNLNSARIQSGVIYKELLDILNQKISGASKLKLQILSAHDDVIIPFLFGLGLFDYAATFEDWLLKSTDNYKLNVNTPDFSSTVFLELYQEPNLKYSVKLLFNDKEQIIPGCNNVYCNYETFQNILSNLIIPNYNELCHATQDQFYEFLSQTF